MTKWISVKDTLPPRNKWILGWSNAHQHVLRFMDDHELDITHWMPLPEAPNKEPSSNDTKLKPLYYPSEQVLATQILSKRFMDISLKYQKVLQALKEVGDNYENIDSGWVKKLVIEIEKTE